MSMKEFLEKNTYSNGMNLVYIKDLREFFWKEGGKEWVDMGNIMTIKEYCEEINKNPLIDWGFEQAKNANYFLLVVVLCKKIDGNLSWIKKRIKGLKE